MVGCEELCQQYGTVPSGGETWIIEYGDTNYMKSCRAKSWRRMQNIRWTDVGKK